MFGGCEAPSVTNHVVKHALSDAQLAVETLNDAFYHIATLRHFVQETLDVWRSQLLHVISLFCQKNVLTLQQIDDRFEQLQSGEALSDCLHKYRSLWLVVVVVYEHKEQARDSFLSHAVGFHEISRV